jgi:hypothetical protein
MPATWSSFRRRDLTSVIAIVRDLAVTGDTGAHGHGVEIVLESPRRHWWRRAFDRAPRDQARIAVTGESGIAGYPINVRLVTGFGPKAAHKIERRDGWATSVTSMTLAQSDAASALVQHHPHQTGEAILVLKRGTAPIFDPADAAAEVVAGTVAALADLHVLSPNRGWRVRIDRDVLRH